MRRGSQCSSWWKVKWNESRCRYAPHRISVLLVGSQVRTCHWMCATSAGARLRGGALAKHQCPGKSSDTTQETQKQGMVQDVSKRITTGPHGLRELWAPTVEKFLLMPLNCAQLLHVLENRLLVMQQRAAMENHPWRFHALCILQTRNRHRVNKHKKTRAEQTLNGSSRSNPPKTEHSGNGKT